MSRHLWGEFTDTDQRSVSEKIIPVSAKRVKLEEVQNISNSAEQKKVTVKVKNPLVTQTIEVMKQTEMLQSLIDTYSNKSGSSNYLLNPCQMIPEVDFPPENAADFVSDDKFAKPFWFIPPNETKFSRGVPQHYPQINADVCRASLRKAVCGQLRVAGFTDTADSALILFADSIEEYVRNFMEQIRDVHANEGNDTCTKVEIKSLEKAYYGLTNTSLTDIHNYIKHNLIARNRSEIAEFNGVFQEYDKLMKESQSMQKQEFQEGDFLNILEMSNSNEATVSMGTHMQDMGIGTSSSAVLGNLEAQGLAGYKNAFQPTAIETVHEQPKTDVLNPCAAESLIQSHDK